MEQTFTMLYLIPGLTDTGLAEMPRDERTWMMTRLHEQKKYELEQVKKK